MPVRRRGSWVALVVAVFVAACKPATTDGDRLYVYNWGNYIGKHTIADFEHATGIEVVYDTYDSGESRDAKLMAGDSGYDVVVADVEVFGRQIRAGVYEPIDRSLLPNWGNIDPHALVVEAVSDPGNRYAVPFLHGINGFAYNIDRIHERMPDAPVGSLAMLFDPKIVARFADCGVSFLDSPGDVLMLAFTYLHIDPNTTRPEDFAAAEDLVLAVRPYIRIFESTGFIADLANQELCICMSWSADYSVAIARARAVGSQLRLAFTVPEEGAGMSYDGLLIPAGAPHRKTAHRFINYMLEPKVIAAITNDIYYGNNNRAADAYVDPEIRRDAAIYPPPAVEARLYVARELTPTTERLRTRSWTRIKTGH